MYVAVDTGDGLDSVWRGVFPRSVRLASAAAKDRLTTAEYNAAKGSSVAVLRGSQDVSVPAKLKLSCREAVACNSHPIPFQGTLSSSTSCSSAPESLLRRRLGCRISVFCYTGTRTHQHLFGSLGQAKLESKDQCVLKDESLAEKEQLKDFVHYFLKVPGYNAGDLEGQTLNLPEHCQDYLKTLGGSSMADLLSSSAIKFQQFCQAVGT